MSTKTDSIHAEITAAFIAAIEAGIADPTKWSPPWAEGLNIMAPYNPVSGHRYSGGNRMICAIHSWQLGMGRQWATYDQWASLSVHDDACYEQRCIGKDKYTKPTRAVCEAFECQLVNVRKGERSVCTLLRPLIRKEINDAGAEVQRIVSWADFKVFNASQVDGFEPEAPITTGIVDATVDAAFYFGRTIGATIVESDAQGACFIPKLDQIVMPTRTRWIEPERCFSTMCHELTHWTGHPDRLAREPQVAICKGQPYGRDEYAKEELIAELGAAFLCSEFDRVASTRDDHLPYLSNWLNVLAEDPKLLWWASGKAQFAANYLVSLYDMNKPSTEMFEVVAELEVEV